MVRFAACDVDTLAPKEREVQMGYNAVEERRAMEQHIQYGIRGGQ